MALFYSFCVIASLFLGWFVLKIALYPVYRLLGGGDNFVMYLQYMLTGAKTW